MKSLALSLILMVLFPLATFAASGSRTVHHGAAEFLGGELDGLTVGPGGELRPGPVSLERFSSPSVYIWSLALDRQGRLIAGTGEAGGVVRLEGDRLVELARFEDQITMDLIDTPSGILAATGPQGRIYRVADDGTFATILDRDEPTIWALAASARDGRWLAGVGPDARLLRFDADGEEVEVISEFPASIVMELLRTPSSLWVATEGPAMLVRFESEEGPYRLRYDAGDAEIHDLVDDGAGGVFFLVLKPGDDAQGTPPLTRVLHLPPEGSAEELWRADLNAMSMAMAPDGALLVGETGNSRVHRIDREGRAGLWSDFGTGDASALLTAGDYTWIGTGNLGDLFRLGPPASGRGIFRSPVIGTPGVESWGRLWVEGVDGGIRFATRSGMRSTPDETWSEWSGWKKSGEVLDSPLADYLQYRIELDGVELTGVDLGWSRRNHAPRVQQIGFLAGESADAWSGGGDYQGDYPGNHGNGANGGGATGSAAWLLSGLAHIRFNADDSDRDPVRARVEVQAVSGGPWYTLADESDSDQVDWDTTQFADGAWHARVSVHDGTARANTPVLRGELVSSPVVIDNTPPRLDKVSFNGGVLHLVVRDRGSRVESVTGRRSDNSEFLPLSPVDGVFDGPVEEFDWKIEAGEPVWIRIRDAAGNETVVSPQAGN